MLDTTNNSFHGKLILSVIEYWGTQTLFEQNNQTIRDSLKATLSSSINIDTEIEWNMSPDLIDRNTISGHIAYMDENEITKVMTFSLTPVGVKIQENEK